MFARYLERQATCKRAWGQGRSPARKLPVHGSVPTAWVGNERFVNISRYSAASCMFFLPESTGQVDS